jgi:hypothetical protein
VWERKAAVADYNLYLAVEENGHLCGPNISPWTSYCPAEVIELVPVLRCAGWGVIPVTAPVIQVCSLHLLEVLKVAGLSTLGANGLGQLGRFHIDTDASIEFSESLLGQSSART